MSNITITNVLLGSVLFQAESAVFNADEITVGAGVTLAEGTILARDSVSGKLVPFVKGGTTNEDGIPKTVLTYDVTNDGGAPADIAARVPANAKVYVNKLIIAADGDASNVDAVVIDQLRSFSIIPAESDDLTIFDNQ